MAKPAKPTPAGRLARNVRRGRAISVCWEVMAPGGENS
jgi:hypothetical protein